MRWWISKSAMRTDTGSSSMTPRTIVTSKSSVRPGRKIVSRIEVPAGLPQYRPEHLKPASRFRLIGRDVPRVDVPDKVSGRARYGIDAERYESGDEKPAAVPHQMATVAASGFVAAFIDSAAAIRV